MLGHHHAATPASPARRTVEECGGTVGHVHPTLETGDANALETNKINLELLNVRTEARMNQTALNNKLKELLVLNGNQPLTPGRPRPDTTPDAQTLGLTEYPAVPLPADFHPLADELLASDPTLQSLQGESSAARKQISASKQGWLPKLELGYRRNTESGIR